MSSGVPIPGMHSHGSDALGVGGVHTHTHDGHTHTHVALATPAGPAPRLHLRGTVLPEGEKRDLWLVEGRISFEPVADAITVAEDVWIMPGLVDAHCHVGMPKEGTPAPLPEDEQEAQAISDRDAGTLLIRDAGSPTDTRWIDEREDLPRIVRHGRHIARPKRYIRGVAEEIEPADLADEVRRQVKRGDGWIKLVGDWIDRDAGDLTPLWDAETVKKGIDAAHELGARVTAHCFGEESAATYVAAGIDGIEHGTGISDDVIDQMAERRVALVPTMINLENFPTFAAAGEAKFPAYAAHMRALFARRHETMTKAREAGVPIYAGTDAGGTIPHGVIAQEVEALGEVGDTEFALGAASWRAREWLGVPGIEDGASADLVVFGADPRRNLGIVREPLLVILRGRIVKR